MLCRTLFVFLHCVAGNVFYQYGLNDLPCFVFSKKNYQTLIIADAQR